MILFDKINVKIFHKKERYALASNIIKKEKRVDFEENTSKINFSITLSDEKIYELKASFGDGEEIVRNVSTEKLISLFQQNQYPYHPSERSLQAEKIANRLLGEFSISASTKGFRYLRDAIVLVAQKPQLMENVTGVLYVEIASFHNTTASRVERVIRYAVETGFQKTDTSVLCNYFPSFLTSTFLTPTNSHFIAVMSEEVRERTLSNPVTKLQRG